MRGNLLVGAMLTLTFVAGCTSPVKRVGGDAGPAGSPSASASPSASSAPATGSAGPSTPATRSATPGAPSTRTSRPAAPVSEIRRTNWPNAVIRGLKFCGESDDSVVFRNGSNGLDIPCRILPNGARPVYAEFIGEEPANAPSTEDALVLVELGNPDAARRQALVPIQLSYDGRERYARPIILGDNSSPSGDRVMTFVSYRVVGETVQATVRKLDGGTETRRWRMVDFAGNWERY
ncbi:hypothetical protein [Micromonospora noduli]|uniref:hypothetical protein n=1 Tax=Micromonospora noduli TaxID=709876 RepID=UPI000DBFEE04|nr:hypothetical protein [Micromonospora noduli]KAB1928901.1 hypothetical protein F8280_01670 [Micromonospora noduli]RAO07707.1 hypothetical protein GUI43_04392 [Micromonospora noduli]RAO29369.1 hypothetical protein ONO86_05746 [Micromonospora noduli]RAO31112.1 hypothetical protein ONO23_03938 [Micromonospora noduli]